MQVGDYIYVSETLWAEYKKKTLELGLNDARNAFVYVGEITIGERYAIVRLLPSMEKLKFKAFGHKFGVGEYIASNCSTWKGVPSPVAGLYLFFIHWNDVCPEFQNKD